MSTILLLPGPSVVLQGDELGLDDGTVRPERAQDRVFSDPLAESRDGSRTTMPWDETPHHGFSSVTPWLPSDPRENTCTADHQAADATSHLSAFRRLMQARRYTSTSGPPTFHAGPESVIAFTRGGVLVVANLGSHPCELSIDSIDAQRVLFSVGAFDVHTMGLWVDAESSVVLLLRD
jgi:glycosidase